MKTPKCAAAGLMSIFAFLSMSACEQGVMTVSEYKDNPEKIDPTLKKCDQNPKDYMTVDSCINASTAKNQIEAENSQSGFLSVEQLQEIRRKREEAEKAAAAAN